MADSEMGGPNFTYVEAVLKYLTLFIFIYFYLKRTSGTEIPFNIRLFYKLLLLWNLFTIVHGLFLAESYWDWKNLLLSTGLFFLIPLAFFIGNNLILARNTIFYILLYLFIPGLFIIPASIKMDLELYSRVMIPVSFLVIFIPYVHTRWKLLIIVIALLSILTALGFRANILKIVFAILIISTYYLRSLMNKYILRVIFLALFLAPLVMLSFGLFSNFNVFKFISSNESYAYTTPSGKPENLTSDSRTFLYKEVLSSFENASQLIIGKGATGRYRSSFDYLSVDNKGRGASEVGFLNLLLYSGIVGVFIYSILLFFVSYAALFKSNNWLSKMLGLFVLSRWIIFFMEDYTQFDLNFYCLWICIGMISTQKFRNMSELHIKHFFNYRLIFK